MISLNREAEEHERPQAITLIALLLAAFAALASYYGFCVLSGLLPFNAGAWVVGEDAALRGWLAYLISAFVHFTAAFGLWRQQRWAHWLAILALAAGLIPTLPGISAAVTDLRVAGILLWGTLLVIRLAALYMLFGMD